jgi:hypothetical protein
MHTAQQQNARIYLDQQPRSADWLSALFLTGAVKIT